MILLGLHGLLMGPLWTSEGSDLRLLQEAVGEDPLLKVDLRIDPLPRLQLISGIGPGIAARIIEARQRVKQEMMPEFPCRCAFMNLPGVPDRALIEAGPWVLPLPCPGFKCLHGDFQVPTDRPRSSS